MNIDGKGGLDLDNRCMSKIYILQLIIDVSLVQMGRHGLEKQPLSSNPLSAVYYLCDLGQATQLLKTSDS